MPSSTGGERGDRLTPVPVLQQERELAQLLGLYRAEAPLSLLEIGSYEGGTLYHWLRLARRDLPVTVVALDERIRDEDLFRGWAPANVALHLLEGRSDDPALLARVQAILPAYDWVFIDADHSYEAVRRDWESYGSLGRTVVLHDIRQTGLFPEIEVWKLWREIERDWPTRELVDPAASWGGIGVVWRG